MKVLIKIKYPSPANLFTELSNLTPIIIIVSIFIKTWLSSENLKQTPEEFIEYMDWKKVLCLILFNVIFCWIVFFKLLHLSYLLSITDYKELHCLKSIQIRIFSGPYFTVFELNTEICSVNLHIPSEYRKIRTRKNTVFGHFSNSVNFQKS